MVKKDGGGKLYLKDAFKEGKMKLLLIALALLLNLAACQGPSEEEDISELKEMVQVSDAPVPHLEDVGAKLEAR